MSDAPDTHLDSPSREVGAPVAPSYEESTRRLSQIVAELESGDLPLERSLMLFEEGVHIARAAEARLVAAERRIEELLGIDPQGKPITRDFEG
jgi:exodeoxyribonuclease VII small subunit